MARQNDHNQAEELISAYLDKRVSAKEQEFFERHVASCVDCRAQLEATRSMMAALRAMPAVKAPRSFVLPREMARQPRRSFLALYPALRLATVIAAMAFVVLFAGDLLISRSGTSGPSQKIPAAAPAPAIMQAPRAAAPTQEPAAAEAYNAATTGPAEAAAPSAGAAAKTSATVIVTESMAMTLTTATPEAAAADAALPAQQPPSVTPEPAASTLAQQAAPAGEQSAAGNGVEAAPASDPLRVIEIVLLFLAIVLGFAALVARRKQV